MAAYLAILTCRVSVVKTVPARIDWHMDWNITVQLMIRNHHVTIFNPQFTSSMYCAIWSTVLKVALWMCCADKVLCGNLGVPQHIRVPYIISTITQHVPWKNGSPKYWQAVATVWCHSYCIVMDHALPQMTFILFTLDSFLHHFIEQIILLTYPGEETWPIMHQSPFLECWMEICNTTWKQEPGCWSFPTMVAVHRRLMVLSASATNGETESSNSLLFLVQCPRCSCHRMSGNATHSPSVQWLCKNPYVPCATLGPLWTEWNNKTWVLGQQRSEHRQT